MTSTDHDLEDRLDDHLRRTLRAVAATITDDGAPGAVLSSTPRHHPARRRLLLAAAAVVVVAAGVAMVRPFDRHERTEVSTDTAEPGDGPPRLLVTSPGWAVTRADEASADQGEMTFRGPGGELELTWERGRYEDRLQQFMADAGAGDFVERVDDMTVAGHRAAVFRSGRHRPDYVALWADRAYAVQLRGHFSAAGSFRDVGASVEAVGPEEWLAALPASVVRPSERVAAVEEMLAGIPLPSGLDRASPERDDGLVADRYQLTARVTLPVACAWVGQWVDATAAGDPAAAQQAVDAMATSFDWPVLREVQGEGALSEAIWELAVAIAGDGTVDGAVPDMPVADTYAEALGCGVASVST
jgi:hypothetical protein